jgi:hypothetical protein
VKHKQIVYFPLLLLTASMISTAYSAPWDSSKRLNRALTTYDVNRVETVSGIVEKIYNKTPSNSPNRYSLGFHCVLKTGKETIDIHLGPIWYIKDLAGRIEVGDTVQVVGSVPKGRSVAHGDAGMRELFAAEVRKDGVVVLRLRGNDGKPLWSGQ